MVSQCLSVTSITNAKSSPICLSDLSCSSKAQPASHQRQQESFKWPKAELDRAFRSRKFFYNTMADKWYPLTCALLTHLKSAEWLIHFTELSFALMTRPRKYEAVLGSFVYIGLKPSQLPWEHHITLIAFRSGKQAAWHEFLTRGMGGRSEIMCECCLIP